MDSVISNLVNSPAQPDQGQGAAVQPQDVPPAADPAAVVQAYPFLRGLASGKIKGVIFPSTWRNPATKIISPQILTQLGLVLYKPTDPSLALGIFNPKKVKHEEIQKLDKEKRLDNKFPSIAQFVPSTAGAASAAPEAAQADADAAPEPGPSQGPVATSPMIAGPGIGADSNDQLIKLRSRNLADQVPSQRALPGQGSILNSLIKRAT